MSNQSNSLSRLEQVDLRSVWTHEAGDFTPWLAQEENLRLLGETIGIELELEAQEQSVGSFWADIVCKDTATDQRVLIENQLEKTDHSHLGQLLTYVAGLDAHTVVWIAKRFTEEHRAAMDWLNSISDEDFNFFGLEVELWRIGESAVAPKFNAVCKPNDWAKSVARKAKSATSGELTESKQLQLNFWTAFREWVREQNTQVNPTKAHPQHWMNLSIGRSGMGLTAIAAFYDSLSQSYDIQELRVELILSDENSKVFYSQLELEKEEIEEELNDDLTWHNLEEKKSCRIFTRRDADLKDRDRWEENHIWLLQRLESFRKVFGPRVKNLTVPDLIEEEGIDE